MLKTLPFIFAGSLLVASTAMADGSHSVKIKIINNAPANLCVHTFNGNDDIKAVPHKTYHIGPGKSENVKCHGKGKKKCGIKMYRHKNGDGIKDACKADDRSEMKLIVTNSHIKQNDECTYSADKPGGGAVHSDAVTCTKDDSEVNVVPGVSERVCDVKRRKIDHQEIRFKYREQTFGVTGCTPTGGDKYLTLPKRDYFSGTGTCGPGDEGLLATGTDGCSGGAKGDRQIFHAACNLHDACYRSGKAVSRLQCDNEFFENMMHICTLYPGVLNTCTEAAHVFHRAVLEAGGPSWRKSSDKRELCAAP